MLGTKPLPEPPLPLFILLFLLVPLIELYLLIEVGQVIGALPTIALCVLSAVAGAALLRQQGVRTLISAKSALDRGEVPAVQLFEGMLLAVGGVLLLVPGFVTDAVGLACLLPFTRRWLVHRLLARVQVRHGVVRTARRPGEHPRPSNTIEGEYRRHDPD
jgi:UPF0716 protein FxsA